MGKLKRLFKWAVATALIPPSVFHGLATIEGLKRGRSKAREAEPVKPVPDAHVDAIQPFVSRQVWAMVEVQRITGMRPGEVCQMRACDIDTSGRVWIFRPQTHKTEHHGHQREIHIGPKGQEVLRPFLKPDLQAYLFSLKDAIAERREALHKSRKTPYRAVTCLAPTASAARSGSPCNVTRSTATARRSRVPVIRRFRRRRPWPGSKMKSSSSGRPV